MKKYIYLIIFMISLLLCIPPSITADGPHPQGITVDGSICPEGRLDLAGPNYEIKAEYGKQAGGNLFHSFEQFNLHNGESATFTAFESVTVDNIISRVTGGSPSWIDGILRSTIPGADLYFINPAGMMFGSHASLDLSGSFHVSTADYLRLGETERFYSLPIEGEELSVAPPSAFGFLDDSVASISFEGSGSYMMEIFYGLNGIKVKEGKSISIIGGDININGGLDGEFQVESRIKAPGGRLNMVSVASPGEVMPSESDLAVDTFTKMGNINISEGSYIDATGEGAGKVYIRGENFVIDNSNAGLLSQGIPAGVYASSNGDVNGGGIDIKLGADLIIKNDGSIQSNSNGAGGGRRIEIEAEDIEISNGGEIVSSTAPDSSGEGADIDIQANGSILITGKSSIDLSEIFSYTEGTGAAGDIRIAAKDITVNDGAGISGGTGWCVSNIYEIPITPGRGPDISINSQTLNLAGGGSIKSYCRFSGIGGNVRIESEALTLTGEGEIESYCMYGEGGDVSIESKTLTLTEGGAIKSSCEYSGVGGDVDISSTDSILIDGKGEYSSLIEVGTIYGEGAGNISLSTKDLTVSNEGIICGLLRSDTQMDSRSADIILDVVNLEITGGGRIFTEVEGTGGGGNLFVEAKEKIVISGKAEDTELTILGTPSSLYNMVRENQSNSVVSIKTPKLILLDEGELTSNLFMTAGAESRGSDMVIDVDTLEVRDGASIGTFNSSEGRGGDLTITARDSVLITGKSQGLIGMYSRIHTNTYGSGSSGKISLETNDLRLTNGGNISTTSGFSTIDSPEPDVPGVGGDIRIDVGSLEITDYGHITSERNGEGKSGDIHISAEGYVLIDGFTAETPYLHAYIEAKSKSGNSGKIEIVTPELSLLNNGLISNDTQDGFGNDIFIDAEQVSLMSGKITSQSKGSGDAGNIKVTANDLTITDGALISNGTSGAGEGGQITLNVSRLTMKNGYIETSSTMQPDSDGSDAGNAGNIDITVDDSIDMDESSISAEAADAGGGRIDIQAQNRVYLLDSELATSVHGGSEDAGNITIDPEFVILNHSKITADAHGGRGGNIDIVADYFIQSPESVISASSDKNIDGQINIQAPDVDIASDITTPPSDFYDASELMQPPCGLRTREGLSSLVVKERDGVPFMMDDWLPIFPASSDPSYKDISRAHKYQKAGQYQKALSLLLGMHPNMRQSSDRSLKALFLTTLGDLYLCMGNTKRAGDYLVESIEEARMGGDPLLMSAGLNNLGNFFSSKGEYVKALAAYEEALRLIEEKEKGKETALKILINIVRLRHYNRVGYSNLCEDMNLLRSLKEMQKEYADANQGSNKHWFASLRGKTQELLPDEGYFFPSSLSGNYAEDTMESIEKTFQTINTIHASYQKTVDMICLGILALGIQNDIQKEGAGYESKLNDIASHLFTGASRVAEELGDLGLLAYSNGYLGQVYESEGRYQEAFTLTRKAIFAAQQGYFPEILYLWQWQLGRLFEAVGEKDKARKAYEEAIAILKPIQKEFFTGYRNRKEVFNERVRPVYTSYAGLILKEAQDVRDEEARQSKLKKARDTMEGLKIAELVDYFEDECLIDQYAGSVPLDCTPSRTALLYPIILNDRLSLLLTLPEGMQQTTIMVNSEEVFRTIKRLHTELQIPNSSSYLKDAQKVNEWIIDPIEDKLMTEEIDTLIVAPDGVFRLIPFAALYDGTSYLIEKYALATLPTIRLADIESLKGEEETGVLISGLSEARQGFPPLPHVQKEIENIHTLIGGTILKDNTFTIENLKQELEYNACRIVHMATHGVFDSSAGESFLLTYDDKITMDSLAQMIQGVVYHGSPKIELLCLSACQTAKGDERAALGLGGIAVKAGVRSVIATLWPVVDESTSLLMKEFYNQLKNPDMSKTKALQSAQIKILEGADYRHPFFWAPFLLIGNWL